MPARLTIRDGPEQGLRVLADEPISVLLAMLQALVAQRSERHAPLLAGDVRYTTEPLQSPPENEALICSCRLVSDVVLHLTADLLVRPGRSPPRGRGSACR